MARGFPAEVALESLCQDGLRTRRAQRRVVRKAVSVKAYVIFPSCLPCFSVVSRAPRHTASCWRCPFTPVLSSSDLRLGSTVHHPPVPFLLLYAHAPHCTRAAKTWQATIYPSRKLVIPSGHETSDSTTSSPALDHLSGACGKVASSLRRFLAQPTLRPCVLAPLR